MTSVTHQNALPSGYKLLWYEIVRVLGQGAFGITYLAHDINLDRLVAIKEYMPGQLCTRVADRSIQPLSSEHKEGFKAGLNRFISEARTLTHFEHPNLIRVFNVFEENNTAYMVMNYEHGETLQRILKTRSHFDESEILRIILPLMGGLQEMHKSGFIHRDIKPGNVFIRTDGSPVLLDFGSARQTATDYPLTLTNFISPGYAPIEQYTSKSDKQGPWTDIYGLGATAYRMITGSPPPNPVDRGEGLTDDGRDACELLHGTYNHAYSRNLLAAIDKALALRAQDRPATISAWRNILSLDEGDIDTVPMSHHDGVQTAPMHKLGPNTAAAEEYEILPRLGSEADTISHTLPSSEAETMQSGSSTLAGKMLSVFTVLSIILFAAVFLIWSNSDKTVPATNTASSTLNLDAETDATEPPLEAEALTENDSARVTSLLAKGRENIDELQLTTPEGDNAYFQFQQVLTLDPDNIDATNGLHAIADKYIDLSYKAIDAGEHNKAEQYLQNAADIWPESPRLTAARAALVERKKPGRGQVLLDRVQGWISDTSKTPEKSSPAEADREESIRRSMSGFK